MTLQLPSLRWCHKLAVKGLWELLLKISFLLLLPDLAQVDRSCFLQGLAKSVAWDGEGATCLIEVTARGAPDDAAAAIIARSVAASSLVKAAVYGHDPNWGRIACAAG